MRALLALVVALFALAAIGCYHDKYDVNGPVREEYRLPPDEARYNQPDTATFRRKAPEKQQETLMNRNKGGGPGGPGGF
jgi:hypothetical protein